MFRKQTALALLASLVLTLSACGGGSGSSSSSSSGSSTGGSSTGGSSTGGSSTGGSSTGGSSTGGSSTGGSSTGGSSSGAVQTGLSATDFNKQVFIKILENSTDDSTALFFHSDGNGSNYDDEGEGTFAWSITNDKMDIGTSGGDNVNFALKSKVDNKYTFTITEPSGIFETEWHRALPLSLADLDGKILALDVSDDSDCSASTIKITGTTVNLKDVCTDGVTSFPMILSILSEVDNALQFNFNEDGDAHEVIMVLLEGDLEQTATVALIHKINNAFTQVEIDTFTATDREADESAVVETDSPFQVVDQKLIMTSETSNDGVNSRVLFGFNSTADNPVYIQSLKADLNLLETRISGDARARIGFFQRLKSVSTDANIAEIFVAIDDRADGLVSTALLTVNGVETAIPGIHRLPLTKGMDYHFELNTQEDNENVVINFAGETATIAKSVFPAMDIYVQHASIATRVKNAEAGNFAKASLDNLVLMRDKNSESATITYDFNDGVTPVVNDEFNQVEF